MEQLEFGGLAVETEQTPGQTCIEAQIDETPAASAGPALTGALRLSRPRTRRYGSLPSCTRYDAVAACGAVTRRTFRTATLARTELGGCRVAGNTCLAHDRTISDDTLAAAKD